MKISANKKLKDIQKEFSEKFPGLKIEFYSTAHEVGEGSSVNTTLDPEKAIKDLEGAHPTGELDIDEETKVGVLEQQLKTKFGLNAQVFRKSGNIWMQTSATDEWTLGKQNLKGVHSVEAFKNKYGDGVKSL